ncbi:ATP-binding cassette domain-containing protein [Rhodococcus sp. T2V]|uniref:ABC transporter ATP-binding protein n=1 Tax=Rhodococcus sp. T2V TaxID=3034164 RepID=UPI0023E0B4FB|nr:ATP-binding cassette domain-containing protein [Rhodococcus sp. T2V]MDF3312586.1 ATP-binding cassette domain-containing protein [Rhodococcus sp. T2V]
MSLRAENITAGYRRGTPVLEGVSLILDRGETVGLTGPSGSGKTTLARVLSTLERPWSGTLTIDEHPVTGTRFADPAAVRVAVAMLFQSPRAATNPRWTLARIITEPRTIRGAAATTNEVAALVEEVGLTPDLLTRRPHEVSDGQLQRACLARVLAQRPRYLICDEATAMFDAATTAALVRLIFARAERDRIGVLFVSHDRELLDTSCATVRTLDSLSDAQPATP